MSKKKIIGIVLVLFAVAVVFIVMAVGKDGEEEATTVMMPPQALTSEPTTPTQTPAASPTPKSAPIQTPTQAPTSAPNSIPASMSPIPLNKPFLMKGIRMRGLERPEEIFDLELTIQGSETPKNSGAFSDMIAYLYIDTKVKIIGTPGQKIILDWPSFEVYGKKGKLYNAMNSNDAYVAGAEIAKRLTFITDPNDSDFILTLKNTKYLFSIK